MLVPPFNNRAKQSLAATFFGLIVVAVIGAGAALPVLLELIDSSGASGTTSTILDILPLFLALLLLIVFAKPLMNRVRGY